MLEYWMANNATGTNGSELEIEEVLEDPGSAILFGGYPPWLLYFAAGCCLLFMLIGIPGNLITVAALFRTKKLRNATAVFIMNLSVSDLMFCCFNLPLATSTFWHSSWLHGPLLCRLFPLLRYGLVAVSLFTVLAITINRYVMIGHPRLYPKLYRPRYLALMVLATWISGFGALIATWFGQWGRFGLDPTIGSCSILPDVNGRSPKEFLFILAFLTPCIAIVVCYARIFYIVRKTALKSRRNKAAADLVKANLEVKYTKNFDDSALGSSCGATLTTTENGNSPIKNERTNLLASASPKHSPIYRGHENTHNFEFDSKIPPNVKNPSNDETGKRSSNDEEKRQDGLANENSFPSVGQDRKTTSRDKVHLKISPKNQGPIITDQEDPHEPEVLRKVSSNEPNPKSRQDKGNPENDAEDIPFIDNPLQGVPTENPDSVPGQIWNRVPIPNLKFFEAEPENHPEEDTLKNEQPILDLKSFDKSERRCSMENSLQVPKRYLHDLGHTSEKLLSPLSVRYDEVSEDCASSRSDSPSEKRMTKRGNVFRRESRFRSVRGRNFETGKMTAKDKKLLKMILVIFSSFLICYLPITVSKTFRDVIDWRGLNIAGYILIYLTTCINPVIYVVMSSEYRSAYKNVLLCRSESTTSTKPPAKLSTKEKKRSRKKVGIS
ncbi:G-protein coupled receptor moody [Orussus abietinus]|uniref:G-protein coupled receptor moody n=1 Tax=Orussus abietinus TaxID=222816 RepID=UPI000626D15D|nr:G-protein coupled receptor moody [Orussus abietinus]